MKQIIPIACIILFSCSRHRYISGLEGQYLPSLNLSKDSSSLPTSKAIVANQPFFIFLFQPYCPYCAEQTKEILQNIDQFRDIHVYMISSYSFSELNQFSKAFNLEKYTNITILRDSAMQTMNYFKVSGVPFLAFYDAKGKLKETVLGRHNIDFIKDLLQDQLLQNR